MALDEKEVVSAYQNGETWNDLKNKFGANTSTIAEILTKNNIPRRRARNKTRSSRTSTNKPQSDLSARDAKIIAAYQNKMTWKEMIKKFKVKSATIAQVLDRNQIPRRGMRTKDGFRPLPKKAAPVKAAPASKIKRTAKTGNYVNGHAPGWSNGKTVSVDLVNQALKASNHPDDLIRAFAQNFRVALADAQVKRVIFDFEAKTALVEVAQNVAFGDA